MRRGINPPEIISNACRTLAEKGIEFEPVKDFGRVKAVFLKQLDPAGHKVHLLYQALLYLRPA